MGKLSLRWKNFWTYDHVMSKIRLKLAFVEHPVPRALPLPIAFMVSKTVLVELIVIESIYSFHRRTFYAVVKIYVNTWHTEMKSTAITTGLVYM